MDAGGFLAPRRVQGRPDRSWKDARPAGPPQEGSREAVTGAGPGVRQSYGDVNGEDGGVGLALEELGGGGRDIARDFAGAEILNEAAPAGLAAVYGRDPAPRLAISHTTQGSIRVRR